MLDGDHFLGSRRAQRLRMLVKLDKRFANTSSLRRRMRYRMHTAERHSEPGQLLLQLWPTDVTQCPDVVGIVDIPWGSSLVVSAFSTLGPTMVSVSGIDLGGPVWATRRSRVSPTTASIGVVGGMTSPRRSRTGFHLRGQGDPSEPFRPDPSGQLQFRRNSLRRICA